MLHWGWRFWLLRVAVVVPSAPNFFKPNQMTRSWSFVFCDGQMNQLIEWLTKHGGATN